MKLPCQKSEAIESYELLLAVCKAGEDELTVGYKQMRDLLERICRAQMQSGSLQMTDLSARISFIAAKTGLSVGEQNRLHTFRLTSNQILNRRLEPNREKLLRDVKTLAFLVRKLSGENIPDELYRLLPRADATYLVAPPARERVRRMRVCFQYADEQYLYVTPLDEVSERTYLVRYNIPQINEEFAETCKLLWLHAQMNLLDVAIDETGILTPSFIVLEPDYLIDISSLAECFRDYGHHPGNYFLSRMQPIENARPLLLGNIHSMAHPLGAFYDTPHGVANALLLPYVMEYNAESPAAPKYIHIAKAMGVDTAGMSEAEGVKAAIEAVKALSLSIGIPQKLHEINVKEEDIPALAVAAFNDVCTGGNPRLTSVADIEALYHKAF